MLVYCATRSTNLIQSVVREFLRRVDVTNTYTNVFSDIASPRSFVLEVVLLVNQDKRFRRDLGSQEVAYRSFVF